MEGGEGELGREGGADHWITTLQGRGKSESGGQNELCYLSHIPHPTHTHTNTHTLVQDQVFNGSICRCLPKTPRAQDNSAAYVYLSFSTNCLSSSRLVGGGMARLGALVLDDEASSSISGMSCSSETRRARTPNRGGRGIKESLRGEERGGEKRREEEGRGKREGERE